MFKIFEAGYEGLRGPYANKNPASPFPEKSVVCLLLFAPLYPEVIAKPGTQLYLNSKAIMQTCFSSLSPSSISWQIITMVYGDMTSKHLLENNHNSDIIMVMMRITKVIIHCIERDIISKYILSSKIT